jgi:hypothetical protein
MLNLEIFCATGNSSLATRMAMTRGFMKKVGRVYYV